MRLEQFEYLIATIEYGNMHEAGARLHTSTQNISKAIKSLESELSVTLLYRSKYGVFATAEGKEIYAHALEIHKHITDIRKTYHFEKDTFTSKYNDNTMVNVSNVTALSGVLQKIYRQIKDQVNISFYEYEGNVLKLLFFNHDRKLANNDFVFLASGSRSLSVFYNMLDNYDIYTLSKSYLGVNINRNHPLAQNPTLPLKCLTQIPLVAHHDMQNTTLLFSTILSENGFLHVPKPVYISNLRKMCDDYIEKYQAAIITSIPESEDLRNYLLTEHTVLIPFKEKIEIIYLMAYPKERPMSASAELFMKKIFDHFENCSKLHA